MKNKDPKKSREGISYALSFSDILSALVLLLVLVVMIAFAQLQRNITEYNKAKEEAEQAKDAAEVAKKEAYLLKEQFIENTEKLKTAEEEIDRLLGVRKKVIDILVEEFGDEVDIDIETGDISFESNVLFGYNQDSLSAEGQQVLSDFFPRYYSALQDDRIKDNVALITFEGHTDDSGGYMYNLDLSQRRALNVAKYCIDIEADLINEEDLFNLEKIITANGRSYSNVILGEDGKIDPDRSRRVDIKFRLKEEESIQQLSKYISMVLEDSSMEDTAEKPEGIKRFFVQQAVVKVGETIYCAYEINNTADKEYTVWIETEDGTKIKQNKLYPKNQAGEQTFSTTCPEKGTFVMAIYNDLGIKVSVSNSFKVE